MVRKELSPITVKEGLENTEILSIQISLSNNVKLKIIVTYVPPYTTSWTKEKYEKIENTVNELLDTELKREENLVFRWETLIVKK